MKSRTIALRFTLLSVFSLFGLLAITPLCAQSSSKNNSGGFGFFSVSAEQLSFGDLNKLLTANGYGNFKTLTSSFGGGGMFCVKNFLFGGGGAWLAGQQTHNDYNHLSLNGGYGYFSLGYLLFESKHSVFYPLLGIGGGGFDLTITRKNQGNDFSQQLSSPAGSITSKTGGWLLKAEVTHQTFICGQGRQGYLLGIKAGYKYCPGAWQSSINNNTLSNSPNFNMSGAYLTLILGGGSVLSGNQ